MKIVKLLTALTFLFFIFLTSLNFSALDYDWYWQKFIEQGQDVSKIEKNKSKALEYCKNYPDGELPNIYGEMIKCPEVINMLKK